MGGISIPSAVFRDAHEAHAQLCDAAEATEMDLDWTPVVPQLVTDEEIEQFITDLAASGMYDDELGCPKSAPSVHRAVARQWVQGRDFVGEIIGPEFWRWARDCARLAKFGK
jgi:hypothetical protein